MNKNNNVGNLKGKYIAICLCLGIAIGLGLVFGSLIKQIGIGLLIGVAVGCSGGVLAGSIWEKNSK